MADHQIEKLTSIVTEYADFVSNNSDQLGCGISEEKLPFSREIIQNATEIVYLYWLRVFKKEKNPEIKQYLTLLSTAYELLACFLPKTELKSIDFMEKNESVTYVSKIIKDRANYKKRLEQLKSA